MNRSAGVASPIGPRKTALFLELRVSLAALRIGSHWDVTPAVQRFIDKFAIEWLSQSRPAGDLTLLPASGPGFVISERDALETVHAQRADDGFATLMAANGSQFRSVRYWYPTAHMSLISGTTAPASFDWQVELDVVLDAFASLAEHASSAIIHCERDFACTCEGTHSRRELFRIPSRKPIRIDIERALEDHGGLVDAQGLAYLTEEPIEIDSSWRAEKLGHLFQVRAPNLPEWLSDRPSSQTLDVGRVALAPLLAEQAQSNL